MRSLQDILSPIRKRLWLASMARGATLGLFVGTGLALVAAVLRLATVPTMHWAWPIGIVMAGAAIGLLFGMFGRRDNHSAARLVDQCYDLKDRSISTLQFVSESNPDSVRQLQIADAQQHLQQVDPAECVPLSTSPRQLRWAAAFSAATLVALLAGNWLAPRVEAKSVLPIAKAQSSELRETMLPELEQLAEEQEDPEIEKLIEELKEQLEQMDSETLDESDLLATLSEMEQSLAEAREALQLELTDTMMKAFATAIKPSDAMKQAAEAIETEKYDQASEELAAVDPCETW